MKLTRTITPSPPQPLAPKFVLEIRGNEFEFVPTLGMWVRRGVSRNNYETIVALPEAKFIRSSQLILTGFYDATKQRATSKPFLQHVVDADGQPLFKNKKKSY